MKDDQRVALTRRLLEEGLMRLLEKKEIDRISVSELCAESGINRATFYRHYGEPRDILKNIRRNITAEVQLLAKRDNAEDNPSRWLGDVCRYFYDNKKILRVLFRTRTDDDFIEMIEELYQKHSDKFNHNFKNNSDSESMKLTAYCYAGGFYYVLRQWILVPIDKTPEEIAEVMSRFIYKN